MISECSSPAFDEFLDFLGQRIRLKGFDQYKGGLDVRGDTTGTHSIYAEYQAHEIMFHVSTLLPFTPSNKQQVNFFSLKIDVIAVTNDPSFFAKRAVLVTQLWEKSVPLQFVHSLRWLPSAVFPISFQED